MRVALFRLAGTTVAIFGGLLPVGEVQDVGSIVGQVVTAGRPLPGTIVVAEPIASLQAFETSTDAHGRFTLAKMPQGRYHLTAFRRGYHLGVFGGLTVHRGLIVRLGAGDVFEARMEMTKGATISGSISGQDGRPLPDLRVTALDMRRLGAGPILPTSVPESSTDEAGRYRLFGLLPGRYLVIAVDPKAFTQTGSYPSRQEIDYLLARLRSGVRVFGDTDGARRVGLSGDGVVSAPVFYPGTSEMDAAGEIVVGLGEDRTGVDFAVRQVPVGTVSGRVIASANAVGAIQVELVAASTARTLLGSPRIEITQPDTGGAFRITNVTPGRYRVVARSGTGRSERGRGGGAAIADVTGLYGAADARVIGGDVVVVDIVLREKSTVTGRVTTDEVGSVAELGGSQIAMVPVRTADFAAGSADTVRAAVRADGRFEIVGVAPGEYDLQLILPSALKDWWPLRAAFGGSDVLDTGIVVGGESVTGLTVELTRARSGVSGFISGSQAVPAEWFVAVIPRTEALWRTKSRRLRLERAVEGRYELANLPAGEYYLGLFSDLDPFAWTDRDVLQQIARNGIEVSIRAGILTEQNLQIIRR